VGNGTSPNGTINDSVGVSSARWISTGLQGITFSNPERFGGGGYVTLYTPEVTSFNTPCFLNSQRDMAGAGGATAAGKTAGVQFTTFGFFPGPVGAGGYTATQQDFSSGSLYMNFASFAFATESDLRSPAVANFFTGSENFAQYWTQPGSPASLTAVNEANPFGANTGVFRFNGSTYGNAYFSQGRGSIGVTYTFSVFAKVITGATLTLLCGGGNNNFGTQFNLGGTGAGTTTAVVAGVPSNSGSNAKITRLGNGWNRISMAFNPANSPTPLVQSAFDKNDFLVFGAQLEEGSVVTSYIKTEGTSPVLGNQDARNRLVPGAQGFGVTGATYSSTSANLLSKRTATAYGTIVIPPNKSNSSTVSAYIENGFNVKGVSAGANSEFDVSFVKPMNNSNYCVILSGEYEPVSTASISVDDTSLLEYSLLMVVRGSGNKNTNGFRAVSLKQNSTDNSWNRSSSIYQSGLTERIHFMVFGGGTYGQP
jgi:hypothetical protein